MDLHGVKEEAVRSRRMQPAMTLYTSEWSLCLTLNGSTDVMRYRHPACIGLH
ncbi:hypothetical protein [Paenibacillus hunanensis]|uniref:hypothetical protein n=1 Tax=Paenibacillus hunanensis TaxID=539262 RepID=UPI00286C1748|nr:hypothetical protein [Paenibacillus hunanensis]